VQRGNKSQLENCERGWGRDAKRGISSQRRKNAEPELCFGVKKCKRPGRKEKLSKATIEIVAVQSNSC